jgi:phosphoribosylglycinamide formyltransferase-1
VKKIRLAIFISGKGSNAVQLMKKFDKHSTISVALILSNNLHTSIYTACLENQVPLLFCNNEEAADESFLLNLCRSNEIDFIVLAGYLRKIPARLINSYPEKIFNIHPSLLPKFGGVGMYGDHVHNAVLLAHEKKSGITIHLVNEDYDKGRILSQFECELSAQDDLTSIKAKISKLEHENYGKVIANCILGTHE